MIQFQILSGKQAGSDSVVRRFPFRIGRSAESDLRLEEAGVWDKHVTIDFNTGQGFSFLAQPSATVLVNHERVESGFLRNGDLIELGSVQLRFWLAPSRQKSVRIREMLTWTALVALFGVQIWIIYWLLR